MKKIFLASLVAFMSFAVFAADPELIENINSKLVLIKGGSFEMGSEGFEKNETPIHTVNLNSYYILNTEITQEEYRAVTGHNFSNNKGAKLPVEEVSWYDAVVFCNMLSDACDLNPAYSLNGSKNVADWGSVPRIDSTSEEKTLWNSIECDFSADGYRLPTEAEWEYAAGASEAPDFATTSWYKENSGALTHAVAEQSPNKNGLYDMNGNVWEWCQDWYGWYAHADGVKDVDNSGRKIRRGGSVLSDEVFCRNANRASSVPELRGVDLGFRIVKAYVENPESEAASSVEVTENVVAAEEESAETNNDAILLEEDTSEIFSDE